MHDSALTLTQQMEHLTKLDTSHYKSHPGNHSSANTDTTMIASSRKMDSKTGGTSGTADTAKDDGITCYICGQDVHICCNCPNGDLMK